MNIFQRTRFKNTVKKFPRPQQQSVLDAGEHIWADPTVGREKIAHHIMTFGIRITGGDDLEPLNLTLWQEELAEKPFSLKEASEYLAV
jgi:hypothetical protein